MNCSRTQGGTRLLAAALNVMRNIRSLVYNQSHACTLETTSFSLPHPLRQFHGNIS